MLLLRSWSLMGLMRRLCCLMVLGCVRVSAARSTLTSNRDGKQHWIAGIDLSTLVFPTIWTYIVVREGIPLSIKIVDVH